MLLHAAVKAFPTLPETEDGEVSAAPNYTSLSMHKGKENQDVCLRFPPVTFGKSLRPNMSKAPIIVQVSIFWCTASDPPGLIFSCIEHSQLQLKSMGLCVSC